MIKLALLLLVSSNSAPLPLGDGQTTWGISTEELQQIHTVHKATPGSEYSYADHSEVNPEVYVRKTKDNTRYEYYFYNGQLYKIYIVYSRTKTNPQFYRDRVKETAAKYGSPDKHYQEQVFGIPVIHTRWEDSGTILDIRSGAGFIYKVLLDPKVEKQKSLIRQYKKAI